MDAGMRICLLDGREGAHRRRRQRDDLRRLAACNSRKDSDSQRAIAIDGGHVLPLSRSSQKRIILPLGRKRKAPSTALAATVSDDPCTEKRYSALSVSIGSIVAARRAGT